jgi:MFS family permease
MSYLTGLTVLGLGWNFLFVSCTTLITNCYRTDGERARVQSANDFLIFATMVLATFSAGTLEERIGWLPLNQLALLATAVVGLMLLLLMWREQRTGPADNHTPDVKVN